MIKSARLQKDCKNFWIAVPFQRFHSYRQYNHLHKFPNTEFSNHYIVSDLLRGTLSSDLKAHHNNVLEHSHEDILAMKVHSSYLNLYNLKTEEQLAKHLMTNILDHIHVYSNH